MKILIVVVCFKVNIDDIQYLKHLKNVDILIYDNSPSPQKVNSNYRYIHDSSNPGVSRAYNVGHQIAQQIGSEFLLLLDHDTVFSNEILDEYRLLASKYKEKYVYAPIVVGSDKIYSPYLEKGIRNIPNAIDSFRYKELYSLNNQSLINSGLMIPVKIFSDIGGFNEKIKLDFSDIYFMDKYRERHNDIVLVNKKLEHSLSGDEGHFKERELNRFKYYCNGARHYKEAIISKRSKANRFILFRMLRLIVKYRSIRPLNIVYEYYLGDKSV